jgi:protocatechuate 3,4-dioxygenase beta subunit
MGKFLLLFWIVLCVGNPGGAATLSGAVRDSEGAAIPGAHVVVHWDSAGTNYLKDNIRTNEDKIATTDEDGEFSFDLPPGFYDVFISAPAFSPHCEKIRLSGKATKKFGVKLKVSPVTSQELD